MFDSISKFVYWFDSSGWLGVVGLALTLVGFTVTAVSVLRSASAAEQAKVAVSNAILEVRKLKVVTDLSAAGAELDEIKRLARAASWSDIPERLSRVRRLLIATKSNHPELSDVDQNVVLDAIVAFSELEKHLIKHGASEKISATKINSQLIDHADRLVEIITRAQ